MAKRFLSVLGLALHPLAGAAGWLQIVMSLLLILGGGAIGSVVAALTGKFSGFGAIAGVLVGALVLVFLAAYHLRGQLDEIERRPRPRFTFEMPEVSTRVIETEMGTPMMVSSMFNAPLVSRRGKRKSVNFAHVKIANHPLSPGEGCDSPATVAHLTYLHEKSPITTQGRWGGGTDQPGLQPNAPTEHYVRMDFPANGERHELDLAIKHPADDHIYAYDNDSVMRRPEEGRSRIAARLSHQRPLGAKIGGSPNVSSVSDAEEWC